MSGLRAYGDAEGDGAVQLSFTLRMPWTQRADEAARRLVAAMGFRDVVLAEGRAIGSEFSFFVVYAKSDAAIDEAALPAAEALPVALTMDEVDERVRARLGRRARVAGACIGTDAHTVGIDAVLNMKGYGGDPGLERYAGFDVRNLGSQVRPDDFARYVRAERIDVVLASQIVTQKGGDVLAFTALAERLEAEGLRETVLLLCGGPRMNAPLALELGYDAGFGRGTTPSQVATFIATTPIAYGWPEE